MTSLERVQAVLAGRIPDRVPVCLHNFLLAAHEAEVSMEQYRSDPAAAARVHLQAVAQYDYDCICIDLDTTLLAEAMGATSACAPGEPGRIIKPAIDSLEDVGKLKPADPERDGRIPVILEAVRMMASAVGGQVAIRASADQGAFSLASMVRGMEDFLMDLAADPDNPAIHQLLEICYQTHLAANRALIKAGAQFTSVGDSPAGPDVISPQMFQRYARPYEERLVRELAKDGVFSLIHICGDTSSILDQLAAYPYCGFELDYKTDIRKAKETAGAKHVLFGNIDPSGVLACGTSAQVYVATRQLIAQWKPRGNFILNAGCAIPASTPSANVAALMRAARDFGAYS